MKKESIRLIKGELENKIQLIGSNSARMIFADFPYLTTNCSWDTPVDLEVFWEEESKIKKLFREHKYNPDITFKGYTECFEMVSKKEIINYLKQL